MKNFWSGWMMFWLTFATLRGFWQVTGFILGPILLSWVADALWHGIHWMLT